MSEATLTLGSVFAGRYKLLGQLGTGGFGVVYKAVHTVTERKVAIKTLWPFFAKDKEFRDRFLREAKLSTQVKSEYIVDVLDAGVDEATDMPFLVMELLRGESLNERIGRKGAFTPEETIVYLGQIAVALDRIHAYGIIHRDLKPANLFLTEHHDGAPLVKILDFGIAKLVGTSAMEVASATLGTPLYMAPEQFSQNSITAAADVYALAMITFRFLVGTHYFKLEQGQFDNVYLFGAELSKGPPEPATERAKRYNAVLPKAFDAWFSCAANVDPGSRFNSATDAILFLCQELGIAPRPPLSKARRAPTGALSFAVESLEDFLGRKRGPPVAVGGGGTFPLLAVAPTAPIAGPPAAVPNERVTAPLPSRDSTIVSDRGDYEVVSSRALMGAHTVASAVAEPTPPSVEIAPSTAHGSTIPLNLVTTKTRAPSSRAPIAIVAALVAALFAIAVIAIGFFASRHRGEQQPSAAANITEPAIAPTPRPPSVNTEPSAAPPPAPAPVAAASAPITSPQQPKESHAPATRASASAARARATSAPAPSPATPKPAASVPGELWGRE